MPYCHTPYCHNTHHTSILITIFLTLLTEISTLQSQDILELPRAPQKKPERGHLACGPSLRFEPPFWFFLGGLGNILVGSKKKKKSKSSPPLKSKRGKEFHRPYPRGREILPALDIHVGILYTYLVGEGGRTPPPTPLPYQIGM